MRAWSRARSGDAVAPGNCPEPAEKPAATTPGPVATALPTTTRPSRRGVRAQVRLWSQIQHGRLYQVMGLRLDGLDDQTRALMLEELDLDLDGEKLYLSKYLSEAGRKRYPTLLREAIEAGSDASFGHALQSEGLFRETYEKRKPKGGFTTARVPYTAHETLAEGEFNRFYLRGLCRRIIAAGSGAIEVYRARASANPRAESEAMLGRRLDPAQLLADLRASTFVDAALHLPPGPNSGLSGRFSD